MRIEVDKLIRNSLRESDGDYLYHGSGMDFRSFKTGKSSGTGIAHHGKGIYLVDNPDTAVKYIEQYAVDKKELSYGDE